MTKEEVFYIVSRQKNGKVWREAYTLARFRKEAVQKFLQNVSHLEDLTNWEQARKQGYYVDKVVLNSLLNTEYERDKKTGSEN